MNKKLILLPLLMLGFACSVKNSDELLNNKKVVTTPKDNDVFSFSRRLGWDLTGKVTLTTSEADTKLKDIVSNGKHKSSVFYDTFVQIAIQDMVKVHGLLQNGNPNMIEFWLKELLKCDGQNPEIVCLMLDALKPHIDKSKTHQYAQFVLKKHNQYSENIANKSSYKNEEAYNKVKAFVEKLQSF